MGSVTPKTIGGNRPFFSVRGRYRLRIRFRRKAQKGVREGKAEDQCGREREDEVRHFRGTRTSRMEKIWRSWRSASTWIKRNSRELERIMVLWSYKSEAVNVEGTKDGSVR